MTLPSVNVPFSDAEPTGFFPSLSGALRSHHVCERQPSLVRGCWRLSKPLTCSLPVGTLYNSLLKFLKKNDKCSRFKSNLPCWFLFLLCSFPKMVRRFSSTSFYFVQFAALITLSWAFLLQTSSTHLNLKFRCSQTDSHNYIILEWENLSTVWNLITFCREMPPNTWKKPNHSETQKLKKRTQRRHNYGNQNRAIGCHLKASYYNPIILNIQRLQKNEIGSIPGSALFYFLRFTGRGFQMRFQLDAKIRRQTQETHLISFISD